MSFRVFAAVLLLLGLRGLKSPATSGQNPPNASTGPKWEYRIIRLDAPQCSNESALNRAGQEGWELVSYNTTAISFPQDAQGSLLLKPAATGPGAQNNPPTADSFTGTMNVKMSPARAEACQAVFKRQVRPSASQAQ